jgi:hypothetical protein
VPLSHGSSFADSTGPDTHAAEKLLDSKIGKSHRKDANFGDHLIDNHVPLPHGRNVFCWVEYGQSKPGASLAACQYRRLWHIRSKLPQPLTSTETRLFAQARLLDPHQESSCAILVYCSQGHDNGRTHCAPSSRDELDLEGELWLLE